MGTAPTVAHTYTGAGDYQIKIKGKFPRIYMNNTAASRSKLISIDQRGDVVWGSMEKAFYGANPQLVIKATDTPILTGVTDMSYMFANITYLTGNFSGWNTSNVTGMQHMFDGATVFNHPLNAWNVGKVRDMSYMFKGATAFNQPLNSWNTNNATTMDGMFQGAIAFNQPLPNWDVGNVKSMTSMFQAASGFNQNLTNWCVIQIPAEPMNFATSGFVNTNRPKWGDCVSFAGEVPLVLTVKTDNTAA